MRPLSYAATVLFLTSAVVPIRAADTLDSVLARIDRGAASLKSLSANIRRVSHTGAINEDNVDSGTMVLKRSKQHEFKIVVNLTQPEPKSVALDGKKAELYYPKIKTVQELDLGKYQGLVDQFMLLGFGTNGKELAAAYNMRLLGEETVDGQRTDHLELVPKSAQVQQSLKKAELWIPENSSYPIQQKLYLQGGDYMLVTYTNVKINPPLSESDLKLKLPKGVKREYPQK